MDNTEQAAGHASVISNGLPCTVQEIMQRMLHAGDEPAICVRIPAGIAITAGTALEHVWEWLDKSDSPPTMRFLAKQLATANWFDQKDAQHVLNWHPAMGIEESFERLAKHNLSQ